MRDLAERLRALAEAIQGLEWELPVTAHEDCLRAAQEIERLRAAIYEYGESPMEQRVQIDPVQYLRTRYVSVQGHNKTYDALNAEIERLRAELDNARNAVFGMSIFLTNEELAWACDAWPWLAGEVEHD